MFSFENRDSGEVWVNLKELLDWAEMIMQVGLDCNPSLQEEHTASQRGFIDGLRKEFFNEV